MSGHSPSQDQDLRTAAEFLMAHLGDPEDAQPCACFADPSGLRDAMERVRAALTPAQAPDKAGERERLTESRLREIAKELNWYVREGASVPKLDGGWRHPFTVTADSRDLCDLVNRLAPQPTATEASRGVGAEAQGTLHDEPYDPLKCAIWAALLPFQDELLRTGGVTFMGLRNALVETVRSFAVNSQATVQATKPTGTEAGWKLVPVEADDAMREAGVKDTRGDVSYWEADEIWSAMIAATPTPPLSPDSTGPAASEKPGWFDPADDDRDDVIALLKDTNAWQAKRINELLAAITPSAPNAAPVREDGARRHEWCQPGDDPTRRWLLKFEDTERGESVFGDEAEAREVFHRADDGGWNCYLFAAAPRVPTPASDVPGEAQTERVRHVKRGTEYEVLGEAEAQVAVAVGHQIWQKGGDPILDEPVPARLAFDGCKLTVYRDPKSGKLWCRFTDEFRDGRFVTVSQGDAQTQEGGR